MSIGVHYIYKISRDDGYYYIGRHSPRNKNSSKTYYGSGIIIRYSIKKHGLEKHHKEILEYHPCLETLKAAERKIVNEDLLKDPFCMNLQLGGEGGAFPGMQSEEYREKQRIKSTGRKHTDESKQLMRDAMLARPKGYYKNTPEHNEIIRLANTGRIHTAETRANMSKAKTGTTHSQSTKEKMSNTYIIIKPDGTEFTAIGLRPICEEYSFPLQTLFKSAKLNRPISRGPAKGWSIKFKVDHTSYPKNL